MKILIVFLLLGGVKEKINKGSHFELPKEIGIRERKIFEIKDGHINFHTFQFDPLIDGEPLSPDFLFDGKFENDEDYFLIQFKDTSFWDLKEFIETKYNAKFTPFYIHNNTFIVKIISPTQEKLESIKNLRFVRWVGRYKPIYKFTKECFERFNLYPTRIDTFCVMLFDGNRIDEVSNLISSLGGKIVYKKKAPDEVTHLSRIAFEIKTSLISEIVLNKYVYVIGKLYPLGTFNDASRWVIQTNVAVDTSIWAKGIKGEGVIIGHNDDGLDQNHCFFNGTIDGQPKIVALLDGSGGGFAVGSHGTHTAGSACGGTDQQNTNLAYKGMAKRARLVSSEPLAGGNYTFYQVLQHAYNNGARIHTNSWGYVCNAGFNRCGAGGYEREALDIDNFTWNYPDMTVFFAAGNGGDCVPPLSCGNVRRISCPATAKNDVTVVATRRANNQEYKTTWSSFGAPSNLGDNRLGTDITAPGEKVNSADDGTACGITQMDGTSMATPTAAGAGALCVQYYKEGWYGNGTKNSAPSHNPSSALIRATLVASARDMLYDVDDDEGGPANSGVPNIYEGAGRITLEDVLWFGEARKLRFVDGDLPPNDNQFNTGDSIVYYINNVQSSDNLVIVLSWVDYPGSANTYPVIVNDLDLKVYSPGGTLYWGNYASNGWAAPGGTVNNRDALNTWEIVKIQTPQAGNWKVIVKARNIPQPKPAGVKYPFALLVRGVFSDLILGVHEFEFFAECISQGILLKWNEIMDAKNIEIHKKKEGEGYKSIVILSSHTTQYLDSEVEDGKEYFYKLIINYGDYNIVYGPIKIKYVRSLPDHLTLLSVFPSSQKDKILIKIFVPNNEKIEIKILDSSGRIYKKIFSGELVKGIHEFEVDLKNKGIYFLFIKDKKTKITEKILFM